MSETVLRTGVTAQKKNKVCILICLHFRERDLISKKINNTMSRVNTKKNIAA